MIELKGIKKRWVINYSLVVVIVMVFVEGIFLFLITNYYYNNIEQNLLNEATVITGFFNKYLTSDILGYENNAKEIIEGYSFDEYLEVQALDLEGNIIFNSSGFKRKELVTSQDFVKALTGDIGSWMGEDLNTGEAIMAVSSPIKDKGEKIVGILRFVTSIEGAKYMIGKWFLFSIIIFFIVIIIISILSTVFTTTIINPIKEITDAAKNITRGKLDVKIKKAYNDEIGYLADTINNMASKLSEVQEMKNDFISSISHELRTPLTTIKGWSETILTGDLTDKEETKTGLKIIIKETERLTNMVEELLDFARLESGRISLFFSKINLKKELDETIYIFEGKAKKKGVEIVYTDYKNNIFIEGDKSRIRQVFINILDNGIKFTESGNKIFISIHEESKKVVVEFKDQGIGISKDEIDNIKEKFYKVNPNKEGSGLGLAISNEIIKLHGGQLDIDSKVGEGTKVKITLLKENN